MQIKIAKNALLAAILIAIMSVFMLPNEAKAATSDPILGNLLEIEKHSKSTACPPGSRVPFSTVEGQKDSYDNGYKYKTTVITCNGSTEERAGTVIYNLAVISGDIDIFMQREMEDSRFEAFLKVETNITLIAYTATQVPVDTIQIAGDGMEHPLDLGFANTYTLDFITASGVHVLEADVNLLTGTIDLRPGVNPPTYTFPIVSVKVNCDGIAEVVTHNSMDSTLQAMITATSAPSTSEWNKISSFTPYDKSDTTTYATGIGYVKAACYQKNVGCERIKLFCPDTNTRYNSYWDWLHGVQAANGGGGLLSPNPCASALDTILLGEKATVYPVPADRSEGITVAINSALVPYIQSGTISVVDYATNEVLHTFTLTNLAEMHIAGNYFSAAAGMQSLKISLQLNDPCKGIITNNSYLTFILQ